MKAAGDKEEILCRDVGTGGWWWGLEGGGVMVEVTENKVEEDRI